jgi:hypothetical protein
MGTAVDAKTSLFTKEQREKLRAGLSLEESVKNAFGWKVICVLLLM